VPQAGGNLAYETWMRGDAVQRGEAASAIAQQQRANAVGRGGAVGGRNGPPLMGGHAPPPLPGYQAPAGYGYFAPYTIQ